ncbi:glycosyltransferase, partial [Leucobacter sp. M11]|uniref:glycosyltransferase n=1 Tax=Leucobacter sp. M11 TaxID=2993565 RepID=UPI002D80190C
MAPSPLSVSFVVLHTSPLDAPGTKDAGGMNVVVLAQARELARLGHRVELLTRRSDPGQPAASELEPGLTIRHLDAGDPRLLAKGEHEALIGAFGTALAEHLTAHRPDVLHAHHWFSGIAALPGARALGVPLVQSFHSIAADPLSPLADGERPESPGRRAGEERLARAADLVITVSEAERRTVIDRLAGDPDRVRVVPPGVDPAVFRPLSDRERAARAEAARPDARPEVLVIGRLHPLKGIDLAVAALAALPERERPSLGIIGAPPPDGDGYLRSLRAAIAAAGMAERTDIAGALTREDLAARIRAADLVVIPSHSETFGLVALEAAASGVPVIARDTGGLREAVRNGETGVLLSGDDPAEWGSAILGVLR